MTKEQWEKIKHFKKREFQCKCGCGKENMNYIFVLLLDSVRSESGVRLPVSSGFRCRKHNKEVGGSQNSDHPKNKGTDVRVSRRNAWKVVRSASKRGLTIGVSQKGKQRFLHLGLREIPTIWSY